jgi:DNA polymerase-1
MMTSPLFLANLIKSSAKVLEVTSTGVPQPISEHLFYSVLGLTPIRKRQPNGKYSVTVDRKALERLALNFAAEPLCSRLLLLRDLDKKRQVLETRLDSDGRSRTNINIAGTTTGRLASSISDFGTGGNQQNIDRDLREIYIADKGMKFLNLDLEQGDSRNVGALCWNIFVESYGEAFADSYLKACQSSDLHRSVAEMVWPGVDPTKLFYRNDTHRQMAKKLGHGTNFAGQPPHMAVETHTDRKVIEEFQAKYFTAFPCVKERIAWVKEELKRTCTLITPFFERRRTFFGRPEAGETQREAFAYQPQSMTADEVDTGLLQLWKEHKLWFHMQVHDSLLCQFPEEREDEIVPWAVETMRVPLILAKGREFVVPVEAKTGWNWSEYSESNPRGLRKF